MKIALAGNPNSGKTTLYNAITGKQEHVGNWAGVTVDKKQARLKENFGKNVSVVDLPGAYSIRPFTSEESITRDFVKNEAPDVIINVVDGTNLNRSLFFTTQLLELGIPLIVALNKSDLAKAKTEINIGKLEDELKCKVVPTIALKGKGLKELIDNAIEVSNNKKQENVFSELSKYNNIEKQDKARFKIVNKIASNVEMKKVKSTDETLEDKVDKFVTNPIIGIGLFVLIMSFIFDLSINTLGAYIADFLVGIIEGFQGSLAEMMTNAGVSDFLNSLLTDGIIGGFGAVMGFLPLIMVLMFGLALIEDSGFMARIAMIFDPLFKKIGLSGKSIVPMIVGYGCGIPGIMASRTIKDEKQRRMTALLTPFVPCGAKVPIIALFTAAFFPNHGYLFALTYLVAFAVIILVGLLIKAITGADDVNNYFIVELPEYRIPSVKRAFMKMLETGKEFIMKAGTIIVACNTIVFIMASFSFRFTLVGDAVENSILANVASPFAILLIPVGIGVWQLAAAAITGFIAKEEVVGTLAVVYSMGAAINEDFELTNSLLLKENMGITAVAALAFMYFNLFTPPCFAAIGAMKAELKSSTWLRRGVMLQFGVGYTVAMIVYQVGTLIAYGRLGDGFMASVVILTAISIYLMKLINAGKKEKSLVLASEVA
ncbi:ferrous iron transport protein B [Clostridium sp. D2Q-11]|uniref:Ferrous iron transport protein B n=1 Tax=Anaeromonas frigoriresistens TaxID=2683708 RepID=A0A942UYM3_9FIRM|nr:ferrous iron transport protein B [Anaeromonas frigoriresistens]MBS4539396.1 ferrous iron transport protein B [Anaeromonas frigoriresistens]